MRWIITGILLVVTANMLLAQGYGPTNTTVLPNFYNRQTQPLSPYLNLLRGGSPAVNYFYGVRPGLQSGGYLSNVTPNGSASPAARQTFFPYVDTLAELNNKDAQQQGIAPTGHPVGFNNTLGYFAPSVGAARTNPTANPIGGGRRSVLSGRR